MKNLVFLSLAGAFGGFVNGFFGTGGGIIIYFSLVFLGCDTRRALSTANAVILVLSLASFFLYLKSGAVSGSAFSAFLKRDLFSALVGGGVGAWLSGKISPVFLKKAFSLLVILCGARMVF